MKNYFLFAFTFFFLSVVAQENKKTHFDFSVSYGMSYIDYADYSSLDPVKLDIPAWGSFLEFNLDYKLKGNRYIGLGFSKQQHSKTINEQMRFYNSNEVIVLDNYYNVHEKLFYDIHFGTTFKNNFSFNLGLSFFIDYYNRTYTDRYANGDFVLVFVNEKNRSDHFSVFLSLEYYFPIRDYLELGIKGKFYYSLNGMENLSVLPTLKVRF